ncbi:DUF3175 domain-containing protein [uncultured Piscinibacter sp.]|uniref:DUF3175 domain-containing protein n=1 Tax=uncultured Piscinibacter sp. TaxID=1131835 RepID=UPI0026345EAB|nr:DUF3175 domain-containing protein [uncultured Piscinibacter sp.]
MAPPRRHPPRPRSQALWSRRVTQESHALDLEPGVFTWEDPRAIAASLKSSADASCRRKAAPFQSAMSMLTFYINRAGAQLPEQQLARLEAAKDELRVLFGRPRRASARPAPTTPPTR